MTIIIAHRGDTTQAPENTMAAFQEALSAGAEGVEFDVQASRDGEPVVIHDESVERTTDGKGLVGEQSLADLIKLDAGSWAHPDYAEQRIPILAEVLELLRPSGLVVNIELKTNRFSYPGLAGNVIRLLEDMGLGDRVILSSFNHRTLKEVRTLAPALEVGALVLAHLVEPWNYALAHGFRALHPSVYACDEELVRECRARGLAVRPYNVDGEAEARRLISLGVDAIITNWPAKWLALRDELAR